jgi:hypothetical protein
MKQSRLLRMAEADFRRWLRSGIWQFPAMPVVSAADSIIVQMPDKYDHVIESGEQFWALVDEIVAVSRETDTATQEYAQILSSFGEDWLPFRYLAFSSLPESSPSAEAQLSSIAIATAEKEPLVGISAPGRDTESTDHLNEAIASDRTPAEDMPIRAGAAQPSLLDTSVAVSLIEPAVTKPAKGRRPKAKPAGQVGNRSTDANSSSEAGYDTVQHHGSEIPTQPREAEDDA